MVHILCDVPLGEAGVRRLEALPEVTVRLLSRHDQPWDLPDDVPLDVEVLLCKLPPRDLDAMTPVKFIQLSSVGYENLSHLGLEDRALRVCNARGLYDAGIAEWNLAM